MKTPSTQNITLPYRLAFPEPDPTPLQDERQAGDAAFLRDLAAISAIHGRILEATTEDESGAPIIVMSLDRGTQPAYSCTAVLMFHDGEVRFEYDLRDTEDVWAQAPIPKTGHAKMEAHQRANEIRRVSE